MFDRDLDEAIARKMTAESEDGTVFTADRVAELRRSGYAAIRRKMRALGHDVPETDEGLFMQLNRLGIGNAAGGEGEERP